MFDHVTLTVADLKRSITFYRDALAPLGFRLEQEYDGGAGFGASGQPAFWLQKGTTPSHVHLAFTSKTRDAVKSFFSAALKAGGRDNGGPGVREAYGPTYFAAFVYDPDGNNIEAVCHAKG